jgi:hypothetical protein
MTPAWREDCVRWWGRVLTGGYRHWCPDWDYLPIDETCEEFKCCICVWEEDLDDEA